MWDQGSLAAADNPVYVENMHRFFRDNAASIALSEVVKSRREA